MSGEWSFITSASTCDATAGEWYSSYDYANDTTAGNSTYIDSYGTEDTSTYTYRITPVTYVTPTYKPPKETRAERRARLEQEQEYQHQQEELRKEQKAAVEKAEELLREHIGQKAFGKLHKVGYIELDSQKHKDRKYRVPASHRNLIEVLDGQGRVIDKLCVHPATSYPAADEILTRLVLLESAEEHILDVANHMPVRV